MKLKDKPNLIVSVFFLIVITIPNVVMFFGLENHLISNENKVRKSFPKINITNPLGAIKTFKTYYLENYGLKKTFVNNYINFKKNVLNENSIPNRVVKGNDGWYFLGNHFNKSLNNSFGLQRFKDKELRVIVGYLNDVNKYLTQRKISFYVVVPPNKNSIYQEYLPFKLSQHNKQLDVLKRELKKTNVKLIDLSVPLLKTKKAGDVLYIKTDTHWNDYGAFLGYSFFIDELNKSTSHNICKVSIKDDYQIVKDSMYVGDISSMINDSNFTDNIRLQRNYKSDISFKENEVDGTSHYFNSSQKVNTLIHFDSFSHAWMPFITESFGHTVFVKNHQLDKQMIDRYNPDIVVFEIVERNLIAFSKQKAP